MTMTLCAWSVGEVGEVGLPQLAWLLLRAAEGKIDLPPDGTSLEYQHGAFIVSTGK